MQIVARKIDGGLRMKKRKSKKTQKKKLKEAMKLLEGNNQVIMNIHGNLFTGYIQDLSLIHEDYEEGKTSLLGHQAKIRLSNCRRV